MEKFTAEQVLALNLRAGLQNIKETIDYMVAEKMSKDDIKEMAFLMSNVYREQQEKLMKLVEKPRGFEVARGFEDKDVTLPERATMFSAGYDFRSLNEVTIKPHERATLETGVKSYMLDNEVLMLYPRSSLGIKKGITLANGVAVIDGDYYNNDKNDGHILICLHNFSDEEQKIEAGERIAQGVFHTFKTYGDIPSNIRTGGTGSTGRK